MVAMASEGTVDATKGKLAKEFCGGVEGSLT